ncbi:hypothetical protein HN592_03675 [Candidatus Woesearchaeota archaeon]|mgnify:CR=1 FL=1|jgi:hypothetical protein|nr:hypothetical protein [Candidatus Woesearchaeota archaeon]MBT4368312.1 hypothetical protein [Candidatus Woesearchaeota archaeon]MBT4712801.1 hypothetical protein [Candidatus Woesearchaeota archaeon]MBT6639713.1 hypothetical protein [Candidatus Woesearchaeota archaeon]MBT7133885.1 hypothetical protein [Candidatus Woesearchaeota archaeon]
MGVIKNLLSKEVIGKLKISFRRVETELNDHLESINSNTNEIQSIYELLTELEEKIEKMSSRVDEIHLKLEPKKKKVLDFRIEPLTKREKEVFFALYASDTQTTYDKLSKKTNFEEVMVQEYVTNLIAKGIPLTKKFKNNQIFIELDSEFKELQAKENLIKMS